MAVSDANDVGSWKPVPNTNGELLVSSLGYVKQFDVRRHTWLTARLPRQHPVLLERKISHRKKTLRVHRLVALAFIGPAPSEQHTVDHINRDSSDNRVDNLRWASKSEQSRNRDKQKARRDGQAVFVWKKGYAESTGREFESVLAAANHFGVNPGSLSRTTQNPGVSSASGYCARKKNPDEVILLDGEEFREYMGIWISQFGRMRDRQTETFAFSPSATSRQLYAHVSVDGKLRLFHRLVACAFPDIVGHPTGPDQTVDHINRDRTDNRASNLRWADASTQALNQNNPYTPPDFQRMEVDMRPPGGEWTPVESQMAACRLAKSLFGAKIAQASVFDSIRSGRAITKGPNKGWQFRRSRQ